FDGEIIPDLSGLALQLLPRTLAPALNWMAFHDPVGDVNVVNVLFANMIAAKPNVMIPVANLPLQIDAALIATVPNPTADHPGNAYLKNIPIGAVWNPFNRFDVAATMATLRARRHFEILLSGFIGRLIDEANPWAVHGYWFFHDHVLAGRDT